MNRTAFKIAASSVVVSLTMVACAAQSDAMRRRGPAVAVPANQPAAASHEQALRALRDGQLGDALIAGEQAVAQSPRDAGYRLLLAEIYMKSGRFEAARTTFGDVLELDPSNARAALSFSLMQIALGRPQAAVAQLDNLAGRAQPADLGLAYALAGLPERAIEILEPAARAQDASPRLRQNLALSYALAGDWRRARTVAAQDISPADLGPRLQQWASLARPDAVAGSAVAGLLGVAPVQDPGQPTQLALIAPASAPVQVATAQGGPAAVESYAEAYSTPAVTYVEAPPAPAPVAAVQTASNWGLPAAPDAPAATVQTTQAEAVAPVEAVPAVEAASYYVPEPVAPIANSEEEVRFVAAAETLTRPTPAVVRTASVSLPIAPVFRRAAPAVRSGNSRFVVQLGAFSNEGNAERAWLDTARRFGLNGRAPLTTTFNHDGRTLHRVSVAGFASQVDAARMCQSIKARGGACFVRTNAGDASIRWAARYAPGRNRSV